MSPEDRRKIESVLLPHEPYVLKEWNPPPTNYSAGAQSILSDSKTSAFVEELFVSDPTRFSKRCTRDFALSEGEARWLNKLSADTSQSLLSTPTAREYCVRLYLYLVKHSDDYLRSNGSSLSGEIKRVAKLQFDQKIERRVAWIHSLEYSERYAERIISADFLIASTASLRRWILGMPFPTFNKIFHALADIIDSQLQLNLDASLPAYFAQILPGLEFEDFHRFYSDDEKAWKARLAFLGTQPSVPIDQVNDLIDYNDRNKSLRNIYLECSKLICESSFFDSLFFYAQHVRISQRDGINQRPAPQNLRNTLIERFGMGALHEFEEAFTKLTEGNVKEIISNTLQAVTLESVNLEKQVNPIPRSDGIMPIEQSEPISNNIASSDTHVDLNVVESTTPILLHSGTDGVMHSEIPVDPEPESRPDWSYSERLPRLRERRFTSIETSDENNVNLASREEPIEEGENQFGNEVPNSPLVSITVEKDTAIDRQIANTKAQEVPKSEGVIDVSDEAEPIRFEDKPTFHSIFSSDFQTPKPQQVINDFVEEIPNPDYHSYASSNLKWYDAYGFGTKVKEDMELSGGQVRWLNAFSPGLYDDIFKAKEMRQVSATLYLQVLKRSDKTLRESGSSLKQELEKIGDAWFNKRNDPGFQSWFHIEADARYRVQGHFAWNLFKNLVMESLQNSIYGSKLFELDNAFDPITSLFGAEFLTLIAKELSAFHSDFTGFSRRTLRIFYAKPFRWKKTIVNIDFSTEAGKEKFFTLCDYNDGNTSLKNLFFEGVIGFGASNKIECLQCYAEHYLCCKSGNKNPKSLPLKLRKELFLSKGDIDKWKSFISELDKAKLSRTKLRSVLENLFLVKPKVIQLNSKQIRRIESSQSKTVEVLDSILSEEASVQPRNGEKTSNDSSNQPQFDDRQLEFLKLLHQEQGKLSTEQVNQFCKEQSTFKNSLIVGINEIGYEVFKDLLIEESVSGYRIAPDLTESLSFLLTDDPNKAS